MDESRDENRPRHSSEGEERYDNYNRSFDNYNTSCDNYNTSCDNYNQGFTIYDQNIDNNELHRTVAAHDGPISRENEVVPETMNCSSSSDCSSSRTTSSGSETTCSSSGFASSSCGSEEESRSCSSTSGGATYDGSGSSNDGSETTSNTSSSESSSVSSIESSSSSEYTCTSSSSTSAESSSGYTDSSGYYECTSTESKCSSTESKYSSTESNYSSTESKYSSTESKYSSTESNYSSTESKDSSTESEYGNAGYKHDSSTRSKCNSTRSKCNSTGSEYSSTGSDSVGIGSEYITYACEYEYEAMPMHYRSMPFASLGWSISFSGCGFLGIYHLGVVHSLTRHGRKLILNISKFGGASAGSLIASALATRGFEQDIIEESAQFCYDLAETARNKTLGVLSPTMSLLKPVRAFLAKVLPEDAHLRATNRLYVSVTELVANENHLVCEFTSKEHLINCLLASSFIPYLTGKELILIGKKCYVDGGMTDNMPEIPGARTILVSPFAGRQHICPVDVVGKRRFVHIHGEEFDMTVNNMKRAWHAFFPPSQEDLEKYFDRGKRDCIRFLKKENLYQNAAWPS